MHLNRQHFAVEFPLVNEANQAEDLVVTNSKDGLKLFLAKVN